MIKNNFICMKDLKQYINEGFKLSKDYKKPFNYYPKTIGELDALVQKLIKERGNEANLNDIDTSQIDNMQFLFTGLKFDGDISGWDVSNVKDMNAMFYRSTYTGKNGGISKWDVSNVIDMSSMFAKSNFDGDISNWNVHKVIYMSSMFDSSVFDGDLSNWDVSSVENMNRMFRGSKFTGKNGDISGWNVKPKCLTKDIFTECELKIKKPDWV